MAGDPVTNTRAITKKDGIGTKTKKRLLAYTKTIRHDKDKNKNNKKKKEAKIIKLSKQTNPLRG